MAAQTNARSLMDQLQFDQARAKLGFIDRSPDYPLDSSGRFLVRAVIGSGGTGVVYRGWDTVLERQIALKVLRDAARSSRQFERSLIEGAKALATINNPHILVIYDIGRGRGGELFVATQFVDGSTLREWQRGRDLARVLSVYIQAGVGLASAHERGVVHGDFKPDNVLVERGPPARAYVCDFGITQRLDDSRAAGEIGTRAYMAPERLDGRPATAASDQFAFCVALWEACRGTRPWPGVATATCPPRPPTIPRWLYRLLRTGLCDAPEQRHASLRLLVAQLERHHARQRSPSMLTGSLALALVGTLVAHDCGAELPSCDQLAETDGDWSDTAIATLHEKLEAELDRDSADRIVGRLAANVAFRRGQEFEVCLESSTPGGRELELRREVCLEHWRRRTRQQLDALMQLEPGQTPRAGALLSPLDDFAELCTRVEGLPEIEEEVQELLDAAENAELLLDLDRAEQLAREVVELARATGRSCAPQGEHSSELSHAYFRLAHVNVRRELPDRARMLYEAGLEHACSDDPTLLDARLQLARVLALQQGNVDAASVLLAEVRRTLDEADEPLRTVRRSELYEAEAYVALGQDQPERAIAAYRRALDALGDEAKDPLRAARLHENLGAVYHRLEDYQAAREAYDQARACIVNNLGPAYPRVETHMRSIQFNEALLAFNRGEFGRADELLSPLLDAPEPYLRVRAMSVRLSMSFDGVTTSPDELELALALAGTLAEHPELEPRVRAEALGIAGQLLVGAEDPHGLELIEQGVELWRRHFPRDPNHVRASLGLALALWNLGQTEAALSQARYTRGLDVPPELESVLRDLEGQDEPGPPPSDRGPG